MLIKKTILTNKKSDKKNCTKNKVFVVKIDS